MTTALGATWELQKALKTVLSADATLIALLKDGANSVLDDVPEDEQFPYLTIGDIVSDENETSTELGLVHQVTVNVWAKRTEGPAGSLGYEGRKTVRDILTAVDNVLNHELLTLTGYTNVNLMFQFAQVFRDDDDLYHGVARYRAVTQP